jgi:hypothetical protein
MSAIYKRGLYPGYNWQLYSKYMADILCLSYAGSEFQPNHYREVPGN